MKDRNVPPITDYYDEGVIAFAVHVFKTNPGAQADLVAGFVSVADALTFVKKAHFPSDYVIYDPEAIEGLIFDTRGLTMAQVRDAGCLREAGKPDRVVIL